MKILDNGIEITYMGHSTFSISSQENRVILIDPWIKDNPLCPDSMKEIEEVDIIAVTHGHFDHMADVPELCIKHQPVVIANFEICDWLGSKGINNCSPMNKGGTQSIDGIKFTMTHAQHSSGIKDDDGKMIYGGEPGGYVIEFENGYRVYHAGDTNLFSDMRLIAELYSPDIAILPIGDHFTMSPLEASYACGYLSSKYVIPVHYGTFPVLTGTPSELEKLTEDIKDQKIIAMNPGETLT